MAGHISGYSRWICSLALVLFSSGSVAQQSVGFYFGADLNRSSLDGGFDGKRGFLTETETEATLAPNIQPGLGFSLFAGAHLNPAVDLEMNYRKSTHDSTWTGSAGTKITSSADISEFTVNARVTFLPSAVVRPSAFVGYGMSRAVIDKGAVTFDGFEKATYSGTGYTVGAGLDYFVRKTVSIGVDWSRRFVTFDEVHFDNDRRFKISPELKTSITTLSLSVIYHIFG